MSKHVHRRHFVQAVGMTFLTGCSKRKDDLSELQGIDIPESAWTHPFRGATNTNHVPNTYAPAEPPTSEQWRIKDIASPGLSVDEGNVYVVRQKQSGEVLCELDQETGESNWVFSPKRRSETVRIGLPTISKTKVYVNVQFDQGNETASFVYAIDRRNGSRSWRVEITSNALVRLHGSGVAIVTQQGPRTSSVLALDANTGDKRWQLPNNGGPIPFLNDDKKTFKQRVVPTTTIQGDGLYMPIVENDQTRLRILDIESGETQREFTVPVPVESTLVAANGLLYGISHSLLSGTTATKSVYALDPQNESLQWYTRTSDEVYQLGVSENAVYFFDEGVRCVDSTTGKDNWHSESRTTYPSIIGDYVTSLDSDMNRLRFRDFDSGESISTVPVTSSGYLNYVAADENSVYVIKGETMCRFS